MSDFWQIALVAVVVVALFFVRRGSRRAGEELGRKLRGGRDPKPPPRWVVVALALVCAAMAVAGFAIAAGLIGWSDIDGFDRAKWGVLGAMGVVALAGGLHDLLTKRKG